MSENPLFDYISSVAVSLTMSGNTGISPFLTLFLLGLIEFIKPELLNMGETMDMLLASWWSIAILGILAIAELVGKCIPAVDELIDSAEVFVIPAISILATMATMGLLPVPEGALTDVGQGQEIDALGMFPNSDENGTFSNYENSIFSGDDNNRYLQEGLDNQNDFSEGFIKFTQGAMIGIGIFVALGIHFFKMIIRMSSLACSGGCCQPCITILEYAMVFVGVVLALVAPLFAIFACIVILIAVGYVIRVKCCKKKDEDEDETKPKSTNDVQYDEENNSTPSTEKLPNATIYTNDADDLEVEPLDVDDLEFVPIPPPTVKIY